MILEQEEYLGPDSTWVIEFKYLKTQSKSKTQKQEVFTVSSIVLLLTLMVFISFIYNKSNLIPAMVVEWSKAFYYLSSTER